MYCEIFELLFEVMTTFNRPRQDKLLLKTAGVDIDTALLPVVVVIARFEAVGVGELAEQLARDHSTISRQIDKLYSLGLVQCCPSNTDRRMRVIRLSSEGQDAMAKIVEARRALLKRTLVHWNEQELTELKTSLKRLVSSLKRFEE